MDPLTSQITIRPGYGDDDVALRRLAALDSAPRVPAGPLLVAEVDGCLRVALSLGDGAVIADPFYPTAELSELLRAHAAAAMTRRTRRRAGRRLQPGLARG